MTDSFFLSTDSKALINDWQVICDIITEATELVKDQLKKSENSYTPTLLSDRQISDALNGPLEWFFRPHLTAHTKFAKLRYLLTVSQDDNFKENSRESLISETQLVKLTIGEIDKPQKELEALIKSHYEAHKAHFQNATSQLLMSLMAQSITLTDMEMEQFKANEPYSELTGRFLDLNIPMPKHKTMDIGVYFHFKIYLAIHSSLSRQQLPHTTAEINPYIKKFKNELTEITKKHDQLFIQQKQALKELTDRIPQAF